jgi:hypothetical protein
MKARARFDDGSSYDIDHIKVYDPVNDLAVMKINASTKFRRVRLGDSDKVQVMDPVIAVGNTLGMGLAVTKGDINQLIRDENSRELIRIRHSAAIAPGNSGGALYEGTEVIGVNVATRPPYEIHYAIPINIAKGLLVPEHGSLFTLGEVFPPDADLIASKTNHLWSTNGRVNAASGGNPAVYEVQFEFYPLEDYWISVDAPGKDLAVGVLEPNSGQWIGWSDYQGETEALLIASEYFTPVVIGVFNFDGSPVDFGLGVYNILW